MSWKAWFEYIEERQGAALQIQGWWQNTLLLRRLASRESTRNVKVFEQLLLRCLHSRKKRKGVETLQ